MGVGSLSKRSGADHLPVIVSAHQIGTGPFQVATYGLDSALEVSTGDRMIKVAVVDIVFSDPYLESGSCLSLHSTVRGREFH